jgi:hypothetical protein
VGLSDLLLLALGCRCGRGGGLGATFGFDALGSGDPAGLGSFAQGLFTDNVVGRIGREGCHLGLLGDLVGNPRSGFCLSLSLQLLLLHLFGGTMP